MRSSAWLFICGLLAASVVLGAEPAKEELATQKDNAPASPHSIAVQNALRRMGLSDDWYSSMLFYSKPTQSLELHSKPSSLLQEGIQLSAEEDANAAAGLAAGLGVGTAAANPTYVLPAAPMQYTPVRPEPDQTVPPPTAQAFASPLTLYPRATAYAYNPYAAVPYGYSPGYRAPIYAPGGGALQMGGDPGSTDPNDYFAAQAIQDQSKDVDRVYAGGSTNPLWFPTPSQRGSLAYFPGIVAAAPQGPTSEPIPFTVGDNPPNDFPALDQSGAAAAPGADPNAGGGAGGGGGATNFAEESETKTRESRAQARTRHAYEQKYYDHFRMQQKRLQEQQRSHIDIRMPANTPVPQNKRYFRPDTVGDPPKVVAGKTRSGATVLLESLKTPHLCDGCDFDEK